MPLVQGSSRQAISENIRREMGAHKPQRQAVAIALDVARRNRYAEGGSAEPDRKSIAEMLLRSPAVTAGSGVRSAIAQPFVDSYRALSGKMTEDEQKDFAFQAALGLLPVGKAAGALAGRGARRLAAEVEPAYTAVRGPATTEVPLRILDVEQAAPASITAPTIIGKAPLPDRGGVAGPVGRDEGLRQARLEAEWRAGGREPLPGLPREAQTVEGKLFIPGPIGKVHDAADRYMAGVPGGNYGIAAPEKFYPLDKARSARIAQAFDELPLYDPRALESYNAMARETLAQYQAIKNSGLKITPVDAASYPYGGNPRAVAQDVGDRGHMAFFKTEPEAGAFGSGGAGNIAQSHPLLKPSGEYIGDYPMLNNDLFRVVHDYFGHLKHGFGFRGAGEDMAWRSHAGMYSPEARPAMTSETRGQNSWVNYGPHGEFNRTASGADTIYSPQKVALMPGWTMDDLVRLGLAGTGGGLASAGALAPGEAEAAAAVPSEPLQRAEGGRADEKIKPPMPRPNPFRQSQAPSRIADAFDRLPPSYGNLERQMGNPEIEKVLLGLDKINHPPLRPTTQADLDKYWAGRDEFYRGQGGKLRVDPAAVDRMPQSTNIEYRWPVTADDLYGDRVPMREPLGAIRNYASGGRAGQVIQRAGLITSTVPGRTDKHSINVLSGSYILPADHVAHLGQDNSMAGGRVLDSMFRSNRKSPPASGDIVPIVVAGGEYLLEPDQVESVGNGDLTRGHNALDAWVKSARKKHVALLKSLPPPKTK